MGGAELSATRTLALQGMDGAAARALQRDHSRAERRRRLQAVGLVAPLFLFLLFTFVGPIADMLRRSVVDTDLATIWPRTAAAMHAWDGAGMPPDSAFTALGEDIRDSADAGRVAVAAQRLNYPILGGRSLVMGMARRADALDGKAPPQGWKAAFLDADPSWGKRDTWVAIRRASGPVTDYFLLSALDLHKDAAGDLHHAPDGIFLSILWRTFSVSGLVTLFALLLGYPLAYVMTHSSRRVAGILTLFVLLPFWTSLLVRTAAWIVLLQDQGIVNKALIAIGLIDHPVRLMFNRVGVVVAMVHVLLPFMVLPLAAVMRGIRPETVRAARSLGAPPWTAFRRIYVPQTMPGVGAGVLLVFISAIGYYITPALVGGADDQMLSYFIAFYTNETVNWGLASALAVVLLGATAVLSAVYARVVAGRGALVG